MEMLSFRLNLKKWVLGTVIIRTRVRVRVLRWVPRIEGDLGN